MSLNCLRLVARLLLESGLPFVHTWLEFEQNWRPWAVEKMSSNGDLEQEGFSLLQSLRVTAKIKKNIRKGTILKFFCNKP